MGASYVSLREGIGAHYLPSGEPEEAWKGTIPSIPAPVAWSAGRKGIPLEALAYDGLLGCWTVGWAGMFLGIEADGHAHT